VKLELDGRVALVTAGSRGIGLAVARALVGEGAEVAICGRQPDSLSSAEEALSALGPGSATAYRADLARPADVDELADAVLARHGRVDVLVTNTGGPKTMPFLETTLDDWERAWAQLLRPVVQLTQRVAPEMCSRGSGRIIMLSSTWVKQPKLGGVLSSVMRSGVASLAKQLSNELATHGVLVNHVMPGATDTERMDEIVERAATARGVTAELVREELNAAIPLARPARADEIAAVVAFLAGSASSYVTGASVQVDGGQVQAML